MNIFRQTLCLVVLVLAAPASAATVNVAFDATFEARVDSQSCLEIFDRPDLASGGCGAYDSLASGASHDGKLSVRGSFGQDAYGRWTMTSGTAACTLGGIGCLISDDITAILTGSEVSLRPYGNYLSRFVFDTNTGSGRHYWVDGNGKGVFALSNVQASWTIQLSDDAVPAAVPLPAALAFLATGLAALFGFRRRA